MTLEKELTVVILSGNETRLGSLNPRFVQISEVDELGSPRELDINHPLVDDGSTNISKYDELLVNGNKIFRPLTCSGEPCLYVIEGPKKPGYKDNNISIVAYEVNCELGEYPIHTSNSFEWTGEDAIIEYCLHLYDKGNIKGPTTKVNYSGSKTPLGILTKIQESISGEFQFRYEVQTNNVIKRFIDFLVTRGKVHKTAIELGHNANQIEYNISEVSVRMGAGPTGEPGSSDDDFHKNRAEFISMAITKGQMIPLYVTKDENGDEKEGPLVAAPYTKIAGEGWVVCDEDTELVANYYQLNGKEKSNTKYPRLWTFDSSEANKYNLYWDCVDNIRDHLVPEVNFECTVADLKKINGYTGEYYNTGDIVPVRIPGRNDSVQCRITKTTKDPRKPDSDTIEISTYKTSFMAEFFKKTYRSPGSIQIT